MAVFCILLADARSGTTLLGDAVSRSFRVVWPGEIFHDEFANARLDFRSSEKISERFSFFNFRHEVFKTRPELSMPSPANQSLLLREYLEYLKSCEPAGRYLLDVKYASWHHLEPYWRTLQSRPHLLKEAMRLHLPLVHLKRSNLFALYCSQQLATETGVWHVYQERPASDVRLTLDIPRCLRELDLIRSSQRMFDHWLAGYAHELEYETLISADGFSTQVEQTFTQVYGIAPAEPLSTVHWKVTPPLRHIVVNKDDVLSALRGTDFQKMAEEVLS